MKKILFLQISVVLLVFSCGVYSCAAENVTVMGIEGKVEIILPGEDQALPCEEGMALGEGYMITTGERSYLEIAFDTDAGNIIKISENSNVVLLLGEEDQIELIDGEVLSVLKNLKAGQTFRIKTPCATCGARGTVWETVTDGNVTNVSVFEGRIALRGIDKNGRLMDEEVIVGKGFEREIKKFMVPGQAEKIGPPRIKAVSNEVKNIFQKRTVFLDKTGINAKKVLQGSRKDPVQQIKGSALKEKGTMLDRNGRIGTLEKRTNLREKKEVLSDKIERIVELQDRIERREKISEKGEQVIDAQRDAVVKRKIDKRIKDIRRKRLLPKTTRTD